MLPPGFEAGVWQMASEDEKERERRGVKRRHVLGGLLTSGALVAAADTAQARAPLAEGSAAGIGTARARSAAAFGPDPLLDHLNDAEGAHPASAISFEPVGELGAVEVQSGLRDLDERVSGLLLFSPEFLQGHAYVYDDFFGSSVTSGTIGSHGWTVVVGAGGALTPAAALIANAPGYYNLSTGTTAVGGSCVLWLDPLAFNGSPGFVFEARVLLNALNSAHACTWRVGLCNGAGLTPTSGYYFEYTSADASVHCRTARAGARSDLDSGVDIASNRWYRLRIVSDGGGVITFFIDDVPVATQANPAFIPSGTENFTPLVSIIKSAGLGTARILRIDYAHLVVAVVR
jgi:hypothetical protein